MITLYLLLGNKVRLNLGRIAQFDLSRIIQYNNKVGKSREKPKQGQNSLVNLVGIYLCPYGPYAPKLRTDQCRLCDPEQNCVFYCVGLSTHI